MKKIVVIKSYNQDTGAVSYQPTQYEYDTVTGNVSDTGNTYSPVTVLNEDDFKIVSNDDGDVASSAKYAYCASVNIDPTGADVNIKIDNVAVGSVAAPTNAKVQAKLNELLAARSLVEGTGMCTVDTIAGVESRINFVTSAIIDINVGGSVATYK